MIIDDKYHILIGKSSQMIFRILMVINVKWEGGGSLVNLHGPVNVFFFLISMNNYVCNSLILSI